MKKLLIVLPVLFFWVLPVIAQRGTGVLRIRFEDHAPLTVAVNDHYFQKTGTSLTVGDLPRGRNYVKVYAFRAYEGGGGHARLVFEGMIRVRPLTVYYCLVNRNDGRTRIYSRPIMEKDDYRDPEFDGNSMADASYSQTPDTQDNKLGEVPAGDNAVRKQAAQAPRKTISKEFLKALETEVAARVDDADKQDLMRNSLANEYMTTAQVGEMLHWLGFEPDRLAFAQWAYGRVINPEQYGQLVDIFTYSSSRQTLEAFISNEK